MKILGIESSCDETACAVVEDGRKVLSNIVATSLEEHKLYGGVVPEIASRRHAESISGVVREALEKANCTMDDIDAVAVTYAPGLIGALLVGVNFAKGLAFASGTPLVPAKIIAELFIIDLFTLDNKINKYDVASLEYVYPDNLDNFKLNVQDTLYKNIDDNTYGKRVEKLPIVSSIEVLDVKQSTFKLKDEDVNSYVVSLKWSYEQDLGYDKEGIVTLIKNDKNVYVVEYKAGAVNE